MRSGHVLIGAEGQLLSVDHVFSDIMKAEPASLIGRLVADVTAPADLPECNAAIAKLRATGQAFEISKRFVRDNGSLFWATSSVSIVNDGRETKVVVATIVPMIETPGGCAPALLLDCARMLIDLRHGRAKIFDPSLFSDTAWDTILAAYIAEAEGRAITIPALAAHLSISQQRAVRWIQILLGQRTIEIETRETDAYAPKSFRLTGDVHRRLEEHLARAGQMQAALRIRSAA